MKQNLTIFVIAFIVWSAGLLAIHQVLWIGPQTAENSNGVAVRSIPLKVPLEKDNSGQYVEKGFFEGTWLYILAWTVLCAIIATVVIHKKNSDSAFKINLSEMFPNGIGGIAKEKESGTTKK